MAVKSYLRGHEIVWLSDHWYYSNNKRIANYDRPCTKCNRMPTLEGHDKCLRTLSGVKAACCGHGDPTLRYIKYV